MCLDLREHLVDTDSLVGRTREHRRVPPNETVGQQRQRIRELARGHPRRLLVRAVRLVDHDEVCEYVLGDARMTIEIVTEIVRRRQIAWVTRRGTTSTVPIARLRTVEECLADPMPDQSWMDTPLPQEKFAGWLQV